MAEQVRCNYKCLAFFFFSSILEWESDQVVPEILKCFGSFLVQLWHAGIFDFTSFASHSDGSKEDVHAAQNVAEFLRASSSYSSKCLRISSVCGWFSECVTFSCFSSCVCVCPLFLRHHWVFNYFVVKTNTVTFWSKILYMFSIKPAFIKTAWLNAARLICRLASENASHFSTSLHNSLFCASVNLYRLTVIIQW